MRKVLRSIQIWLVVIKLVFFLWWDARRWSYIGGHTQIKQEFRQSLRARWLTRKLLQLGSAFIKLGQLLSARPDVLPTGWIKELSDLQDKVPQFPFEIAEEILQKELLEKFEEIKTLNKTPLGAASIAQVHLAELSNGQKVVFKIQRPGLEDLFILDFLL